MLTFPHHRAKININKEKIVHSGRLSLGLLVDLEVTMQANIKIGKIFGIPIGLNYSWFLIFALITYELGTGYFTRQSPQLSGSSNLLLALVTSLLFFASVLLHELGHSVLALRNRIPVKGITLFIFGGVAQIAREPETPGAEFRIAIAGPLTSFALAGLFGGAVPVRAGYPAAGSSQPISDAGQLHPGSLQPAARFPARRWAGVALDRLETDRQLPSFHAHRFGQRAVARFLVHRPGRLQPFQRADYERTLAGIHRLVPAGRGRLGGIACQPPGEAAWSDCRSGHVPGLQPGTRLDDPEPDRPGTRAHQRSAQLLRARLHHRRTERMLTLQEITAIPQLKWRFVTAQEVMKPMHRLASVAPETELLAAMQMMEQDHLLQIPVLNRDRLVGLISRENVLRVLRLRSELGI